MNYSRNKYVISLVIPVITAVSFTFMGIFGLMFERYKTFNHTTVLYLALCVITFAIDIYLYKALYNDTINFLEDTEVYLQFLRL